MNEEVLGREAANILEAPAFRIALDALERSYIEKWRTSNPKDTDDRERAYLALQVLEDLTRELRVLVDAGKVESSNKARATRRRAS